MIFRFCIAAAAVGLAFTAAVPVAHADVARRCDWRGCTYIVCHWNGNRCRRYDSYGYDDGYRRYDDYYLGDRHYYDNAYYRHRDWNRGRHYDCDRDADDCYVRRSWGGY